VEEDFSPGIYRAMLEDNGLPKLGATATALGIRLGKDIVPDPAGLVHLPAFNAGEENGLSCAPSIPDLPRFALPLKWGGINRNTVVWLIQAVDLGPLLIVHEDTQPGAPRRHLSIGPSTTMSYDDYVNAIEATQSKWSMIRKP
jgi:hypothetical protein